jgi:hypothetical protein
LLMIHNCDISHIFTSIILVIGIWSLYNE